MLFLSSVFFLPRPLASMASHRVCNELCSECVPPWVLLFIINHIAGWNCLESGRCERGYSLPSVSSYAKAYFVIVIRPSQLLSTHANESQQLDLNDSFLPWFYPEILSTHCIFPWLSTYCLVALLHRRRLRASAAPPQAAGAGWLSGKPSRICLLMWLEGACERRRQQKLFKVTMQPRYPTNYVL